MLAWKVAGQRVLLSGGRLRVLAMLCDHVETKPGYQVFGSVNESVGVARGGTENSGLPGPTLECTNPCSDLFHFYHFTGLRPDSD